MQNILSKKLGFVFLLFVTLLASYFILTKGNPSSPDKIVYSKPSFITDVRDDRKLSGIAQNLFIGEVKAQVGNKKLDNIPETQYKVEVIQNIKGSLNGAVTVNQQGGFNGNTLMLMEGDKLLEVGKTYLFVTLYNREQNWYTLVPAYGDIPVENDLKKKDLIERFTKAHKEEIPVKYK